MAPRPQFLELSNDIQDEADWVIGQLREFDVPLTISACAIEPTTRLLATGTSDGALFIHGGPAVEVKIRTPSSVGVKFLSFASLSQKLLAIDDEHVMHVWDLTAPGGPEYLKAARFDPVTSFSVSPSMAHVFVGLQTGEIKTYDLACLRKSEYTIPNMWKLYQQNAKAQRTRSAIPISTTQPCVDQQLHPRDLNRIFVAYPGGIILSDLTDRSTTRVYELSLPPGAPGGLEYGTDDVITHRQPEVTCLTIHPSGHFFAVGHADGSIAFWAVDDDTHPLLVRTLDEEEVHTVHSEGPETKLESSQQRKGSAVLREPIFKLAWSSFSNSKDPRGGPTTLTVLGGLHSSSNGSVTVLLLPAFQPPEPPTDSGPVEPTMLHPFFRAAMCDCLKPANTYAYKVDGEVQDFLLCPREHLHLGGNHDPYAIICLQSTLDGSRVLQTFQFPPFGWNGAAEQSSASGNPAPMDMPFAFIHGSASLIGAQLVSVDTGVYGTLQSATVGHDHQRQSLQLSGGVAFADQKQAGELRSTKYHPHRIMITHDNHARLRFFDFSGQLLSSAPPNPLDHHFPHPLPGLTIDLSQSLSFMLNNQTQQKPDIKAFSFAPEALEVAVALQDGSVVVCCSPTANLEPPEDTSILMLNPDSIGLSGLCPVFLVKGGSKVQACSMSNIGFLAVSYVNGEVAIVDMRGPRILSRLPSKSKHRHGGPISHRLSADADVATSLAWSITPTSGDRRLQVRLLIARVSGSLDVCTLGFNSLSGVWGIAGTITANAVSDPLPEGIFVLDSKTGSPRASQRGLFAQTLRNNNALPVPSILAIVGAKGARTNYNVDGERLGKADWGHRNGRAVSAQVVERLSSKALVVLTENQSGLAYSLPSLELINTFKTLPFQPRAFTVDQTGDWVALYARKQGGPVEKIAYGTFFDIRRVRSPPEIDLALKKSTAAQPQPVSMGPASLLSGWLNYYQGASGKQIDDLLGGPNRPIIVKALVPSKVESGTMADNTSTAASSVAASSAHAQSTIFNRLTAAMNERGQMLGDLEERFKSLETGSQNMVAQAKKLAAQQTAKSWFGL